MRLGAFQHLAGDWAGFRNRPGTGVCVVKLGEGVGDLAALVIGHDRSGIQRHGRGDGHRGAGFLRGILDRGILFVEVLLDGGLGRDVLVQDGVIGDRLVDVLGGGQLIVGGFVEDRILGDFRDLGDLGLGDGLIVGDGLELGLGGVGDLRLDGGSFRGLRCLRGRLNLGRLGGGFLELVRGGVGAAARTVGTHLRNRARQLGDGDAAVLQAAAATPRTIRPRRPLAALLRAGEQLGNGELLLAHLIPFRTDRCRGDAG